jgi:hypothetical protein
MAGFRSMLPINGPTDDPNALVCRASPVVPSPKDAEIAWCSAQGDDDFALAGRRSLNQITAAVDRVPELRGAGVILQVPGGQPIQIRPSNHASGLDTYVLAKISVVAPQAEEGWWDRWNGVVLNCGGAAVSWLGVAASGAAEIPSAGASTPITVAAYVSATTTSAQCGLAIAKESSDDFRDYVKGPDGQWVNYADMLLDVISLAGGTAGAVAAVKDGGKAYKLSKYASELDKLPKGQILKSLERLEKAQQDLGYFRRALAEAIATEKVADPAGRAISNNLLKRALPIVTKSLRMEVLSALGSEISLAISTVSSGYGGVGSKGWGVVKVTIEVLQQPITSEGGHQ